MTSENDASSDGGETNSINSDIFHETEENVAFQIFLEAPDDNVLVEESDDSINARDPLSMDDCSHANVVNDSQEIESEAYHIPSCAVIPQDGSVSSSTYESTILSSKLPQSDVSRHDRQRHSNSERTGDSCNLDRRDALAPNTLDSQSQTSTYDEISCGEISSSDIIGSDGLVGKHPQLQSSTEDHDQISDGSNISLSIIRRRDRDKFSSQNNVESMNEDEQELNTLLYHYWLKTTPEDWRRTELTIDSWKDLVSDDV
jgi:hypothetical protein